MRWKTNIYLAETLSERRFLFRHYLRGDGSAGGNVPGDVCHPAHCRLAGTMAGDDQRPGAKNRPATPNLCWTAAPRLAEEEELTNSMTPAAITASQSISHSSPIAVFQNSSRYLRRASDRVSPASAPVPEPSLGLRQERHFLLYQRTVHRKRR